MARVVHTGKNRYAISSTACALKTLPGLPDIVTNKDKSPVRKKAVQPSYWQNNLNPTEFVTCETCVTC